MKAVRYHEYGAPEMLRVEEIPRPEPGKGQVLVKVVATSFNPIDAALRAGVFAKVIPLRLPYVPGLDIAGEVIAVGEGVDRWQVGDAVIGYLPRDIDGACAEYTAVPAEVLTTAPATVPLSVAAALPLVGLTAWQALFEHAGLRPNQRVLVYGAGGAVGRMALQIAASRGAYVVAATNTDQSETVQANGADLVVDYTTAGWQQAVGGPVDVLFTVAPAGAVNLTDLASLIGPGGVLVSAAAPLTSDMPTEVRAVRMGSHPDADQLAELVALVDAGKVRPSVDDVRRLEDVRAIHEAALAGTLPGKTVIRTDLS